MPGTWVVIDPKTLDLPTFVKVQVSFYLDFLLIWSAHILGFESQNSYHAILLRIEKGILSLCRSNRNGYAKYKAAVTGDHQARKCF